MTRRQQRQGKPIIPQLKFEELIKNENDPYVCFRRRETKPIRKTRRTDQQSLERLRKLRSEMEMSRNLLEMVLRREKIRKEGLVLEHTVFEKKRTLLEYQRALGIKEEDDLLLPRKKRHTEGSGATIKIPLHKLNRVQKTPIQLAMEAELAKKKELDLPYTDLTEAPYQPFPLSTPQQFFQPIQNSSEQFRKRVGRNGRVFLDRIGFQPMHPKDDRYKFDSDMSEDESMEIDEMDNKYLKHRVQLLTEPELRNLITIPFLTPSNLININQARQAAAAVTTATPTTTTPVVSAPIRPVVSPQVAMAPIITTTPIKRQNSRTKMTPQQAAVAMANGMIAANMAAVVNGSTNQNRTAVQLAIAAAQQQQQQLQQQQQQQQRGNNGLPSIL